jgi:hypothetical protein
MAIFPGGGGGFGLSAVFVDWDNLRHTLLRQGVNAGPEWVLRALMQAVHGASGAWPIPNRVELHLTRAVESRADQYLLERNRDESRVVVTLAGPGKNMADMRIAVGVADTWHEQPTSAIAVVSSDADIAYLVWHYAAKDSDGRRVLLLHPHRTPPAPLREAAPGVARRLELGFNDKVRRRPWMDWDRAAWTLRRLARQLPDSRLASGHLSGHAQLWEETGQPDGKIDWQRLELVDDLVAAVWRQREGGPVALRAAMQVVRERLEQPSHHELPAVMAALLAAHLLRWQDAESLEVPPGWREGLLLPMRRVVLAMATDEKLSWPADTLERLHRDRFYRILVADPPQRRLEVLSSADSWDWIKHALRERLRAVSERTIRRPDASRYAQWTLVRTSFVTDTIETARRIRTYLNEPVDTRQAAERMHGGGIRHAARWLRCLAGARLVVRSREGIWANTDATLHDP